MTLPVNNLPSNFRFFLKTTRACRLFLLLCYINEDVEVVEFLECTLVGLKTRAAPLIISKSLQFRTFCSQSKALFMITCMLSVESGSRMIGALKVTIYVKFFKLSVKSVSKRK